MPAPYLLPDLDLDEFLTLILEHATDGILLTDATGRVVAMNRSYSILFDIPCAAVLGRSVLELVAEGAWSPNLFQRVALQQKRLSVVQTTHTGNTVLSTGTPIYDDSGELRYVLFNDRDMSLQSLLEDDAGSPVELSLHAEPEHDPPAPGQASALNNIVVQSSAMKRLLQLALRAAQFPVPILLSGESGVGKSMVARFIHDQSPRRQGPFVAINCGAIPEQLLESELFGHTAGAFTGASSGGKKGRIESAHQGTLFLDEISELPYPLQVKLLQFLETKQLYPLGSTSPRAIDCVVVAATNRSLGEMISEKSFREDLYYRLNGIPLQLPPLRERREEIPTLVHYFLEQYAARFGIEASLCPSAGKALEELPYPGNVRELSHLIQRLLIVAEGGLISAQLVRSWADTSGQPAPEGELAATAGTLSQQVAQFERKLIRQTIQQCGSQQEAAKLLGVHQSTLSRKL
ncbi:sigma-54 interaction domain-containing protein [Desulfogranum mediterraneum]|uniref:sigma-54 interaction domain-containing protein n=1 Tax=Desulfogranum mediterraneum TaxID=160661 RepID=UPI000412AAF2|nr:sigma-54-dependent Fis family transcriptional regulator [Desulfogranum mediterraneum]